MRYHAARAAAASSGGIEKYTARAERASESVSKPADQPPTDQPPAAYNYLATDNIINFVFTYCAIINGGGGGGCAAGDHNSLSKRPVTTNNSPALLRRRWISK